MIRLLAVLIACVLAAPVGLAESIVVYSGRSKSLVDPLIRQFTQQTGIDVQVKYGKTAQLALALKEEGDASPADVFWAQDAGALGALKKSGMFAELPGSILDEVPPGYRSPSGFWVATSGRARVLAYSPARTEGEQRPREVDELTDPRFKGRVGWAPTNASFIAFVSAMRAQRGDDATRRWLEAMKANGAKAYPKNTAILQAIAAGEVDYGLPNHYYLIRFKSNDADYPVEQTAFNDGDIGNLINVAGVGILKTSRHKAAAERFVAFLLSPEAQAYFANKVYEYPVTGAATPHPMLTDRQTLRAAAPNVALEDMDDLAATQRLLRDTGVH